MMAENGDVEAPSYEDWMKELHFVQTVKKATPKAVANQPATEDKTTKLLDSVQSTLNENRMVQNRMDYAMGKTGLKTPKTNLGWKGNSTLGFGGNVVETKRRDDVTGGEETVYLTESGNEYADMDSAQLEQGRIEQIKWEEKKRLEEKNTPVEGVWEGITKSGVPAMKAGLWNFGAEALAAITGSAKEAETDLAKLGKIGAERIEHTLFGKSSVYDKEAKELVEKYIGKLSPDSMKDGVSVYNGIKDYLSKEAQEKHWADDLYKNADEEMEKIRPTKGVGAWVGNLIPQMIPAATGMAVSLITRSPAAAKWTGRFGMGAMTASTMGSSMREARDAGASNGQIWGVGLADGAIEYLTEKIPFNRYTGRLLNSVKRETGEEVSRALTRGNSPARGELEKLLVKANNKLGGKLLNGKNVKDYLVDIAAEGASEFTAEALQTITPMIYQDPEEYPTLSEILENGWEGTKAGIFMGAALGSVSKVAEHKQERNRRKEQGFVDVVEFDDDGQKIGEVVGEDADAGELSVLLDGDVKLVSVDDVKLRHRFSFDEFDSGAMQAETDESFNSGYATTDPVAMTNARESLDRERSRMAELLGVEDGEVDEVVGDPLTFIAEHRELAAEDGEIQRVLDYANARSAYEGMEQRAQEGADAQVMASNARFDRMTNRADGMMHPITIRGAEKDRMAWVVDGTVVFDGEGEDASLNKEESNESLFVVDDATGKIEMIPAKDVASVGNLVDSSQIKALEEEAIRSKVAAEFEASTHAEVSSEDNLVSEQESQYEQPAKPAYEVGDVVTLETEDGPVSVEVQAVTADGVEVRTDEPWRGQVVQVIPTEEFEGMMKKPVVEVGVSEEGQQAEPAEEQNGGVEESSATESDRYTEGSPERVEAGDNLIVTDEEGNDRSLKVVRRVSMRPSEKGGLEPQEDANGKIVELVDDATGETVRMWDSELAERTKGYMRPQQGVMPSPKSTEGEGVEQAEQAAPAAEPAQPKRNEIPVDEKTGEPVYEAADPGAAWDALVEEAEGDEELAMETVNAMVRDMEEKVKKAKNAKLRAGATAHEKMEAQKERKRRIAEAEERLEAWKRIAGVKAERAAAAESPAVESPVSESPVSESPVAESSVSESPVAESPATVETPAAEEATPVQEGAQTPVQEGAQTPVKEGARGGVQVPHSDSAGQEATQDSVTGTAPVAEQTGTTPKGVEAIPTRKNNKGEEEVLYHKVPVARTMADLYDGGMDQEEIDGFVEANSAEAAREVKRIEGKKPKMTTNKAKYMEAKRAWQAELDEAREKEAYWKEVGKEVKRVTHRDEAPVSAEGRGHEAALGEDMPKDEPMKREEDEQGNRGEEGGQQMAGKEEGAGNEAASEVEEMPAAHEPAVDSSMPKTSFTQDEAADFVDKMEARAESVPEMELTIENWDSLFGEDGRVETPIGEVKMGENQFAKLMRQGRNGKLGMIKPTLESPDIIIEQASMAKEGDVTERPSSYLFIKAFTKPDGERFYYFTSVSVSRDGKEVIISNQEKSRNKILRLMTEESVIWRTPNDAATSSAEKQGLDYAHPNNAEDETKGSGITPQSTSSVGKVTESQETEQGNEVASEVEEGVKQMEGEEKTNTFSLSEMDSGKGGRLYQDAAGNTNLVSIPNEVFEAMGMSPVPFSLTESMAEHVLKHKTELGLSSKEDAVRYVVAVMKNADHVRAGDKPGSFVFSVENGRRKVGKRAIAVQVDGSSGKFLGISTSGNERLSNLQKRPLLWEKGVNETSATGSAPANVTSETAEQNGGELDGNASNQSNDLSVDKVTESKETEQVGARVKAEGEEAEVSKDETPKEYKYRRNSDIDTLPDGYLRLGKDERGFDVAFYDHPLSRKEVERFHMGPITESNELVGKVYEVTRGLVTITYRVVGAEDGFVLFTDNGSFDYRTLPYYKFMDWVVAKGKEVGMEVKASGKARESRAKDGTQPVSESEAGLRDALVDVARAAGVEVVTDSKEGQRVLDEVNGKARLSAKQKRALETASLGNDPRSLTVVSSATGAKVLNNLDALAASLENSATQPKIFLGQVANAIGASNKGSSSQYATFETKNGAVVTIRLANHNASTKRMDNAGRNNAISIVVSPKPNEGVLDDGNAHVVEFYYDSIKLRKADGHPLAEIVRSIQQALYSGEYKDTTGLAERQEVNTTFENLREHRVFHGSGAEFDAFDHSHMGEGEGAQAYGWGTYVTEVEGIGRMYASQNKGRISYKGKSVQEIQKLYEEGVSPYNVVYSVVIEMEGGLDFSQAKEMLESDWRSSLEYEVAEGDGEYADGWRQNLSELASLEESDFSKKEGSHLYTVEIPNDNGSNYLHWEKPVSKEQQNRILNQLRSEGIILDGVSDDFYNGTSNSWNSGETLYGLLDYCFTDVNSNEDSQKAVSEFLMRCGIAGVSYPAEARSGGREDGARNFVLFNEKDAQITDHVRFFKTENGEAYGFTVGGKIYLDPKIATTETAVHELTHLWADMLRKENPKEWKHVVELMKGTPVWDEVKAKYPELKTEDEIADEVLAHYSGRRGAERLRAEQQRLAREEGVSMLDRASAVAAIERVKDALNSFWKKVADLLGIHFKSAEEVADAALADILNGRVKPQHIGNDSSMSVSDFAAKHDVNKEDVKKYAQSMKAGNLGGASYAFKNIKRSIWLANDNLSLSAFVKVFSPVRDELYSLFGNIDELRNEHIKIEMDNRNAMEAARKREEEQAEAERKRLEEFELMSDESLDKAYMEAVRSNDEKRMRDLVNEAARRKGYLSTDEFRMSHRAPSYDEEGVDKSMIDIASNKDSIRDSLEEQSRMNRDKNREESIAAISQALQEIEKGNIPDVTIYRAVPKSLKEGSVRNGDWVTLSESYAKQHGNHALNGEYRIMKEVVPADNLYWDGNDINEWGYDDKRDYVYRNTRNNRKLNELVVRDDKGEIIPLSKRFNSRKKDVRFQLVGEKGAANMDKAEEATTRLDNLSVAREMEEAFEEKKKRIEKLRKSDSVVVDGNEYLGKYELNSKSAGDYILSSLRRGYKNTDTNELIHISRKSQKVAHHDAENEVHLKSIAYIPQLIEHAIFIDEIPNSKSKNGFDSYRYYVVGFNIGGVDYTVRLTVGVKNGQSYYDHALTKIEKGNLLNLTDGVKADVSEKETAISDVKDKRLLSLLRMNEQENARKIKLATGWERGADGKWRYEVGDIGRMNFLGNARFIRNNPDAQRYGELNYKKLASLLIGGEKLTEEEEEEFSKLVKKFSGELDFNKKPMSKGNQLTLGDYFDADELFAAYPELEDVPVYAEQLEDGVLGYASEADSDFMGFGPVGFMNSLGKPVSSPYKIVVSQDFLEEAAKTLDESVKRRLQSVFIHEIQHLIQEIEGFAKGGSATTYRNHIDELKWGHDVWSWAMEFEAKHQELGKDASREDVYYELVNEFKEDGHEFGDGYAPSREVFDEAYKVWSRRGYDNGWYEAAYNEYQYLTGKFGLGFENNRYYQLAGEVEARNVQSRMDMTAEERRASLAEETEDVAREDQVFIMDGIESANSLGDNTSFENRQQRAVQERGVVPAGLNDASIKVEEIPAHPYEGRWSEARSAAIEDAYLKYSEEREVDGKKVREPKSLVYANHGRRFTYTISRGSLKESVNPKQIDKSKKGGASPGVHLAVLNHLDKVIANSIEVEEHPDYIKGKDGVRGPENGYTRGMLVHRFVGAVRIDGQEYIVKTTMHEHSRAEQGTRQYAYDVTKIAVLNVETPNTATGLTTATKGVLPLANVLNGFEKSYDPGKNLLEESKKEDRRFAESVGEQETDDDLYRNVFGGNSGYVGYSMSRRASKARSEGRFPKGDFKREYGLTDTMLNLLVENGAVSNSEWHHTSMFGNRTPFYGWEDYALEAFEEHTEELNRIARSRKLTASEKQEAVDKIMNESMDKKRAIEESAAGEQQRLESEYAVYRKEAESGQPARYEASNGAVVVKGTEGLEVYNSQGERLTKRNGKLERNAAIEEYSQKFAPAGFNQWMKDTHPEVDNSAYREVEQSELLDELRKASKEGRTVRVYRTMQVIDGKLYSPMAKKVAGQETSEIKFRWEAAEEHPELARRGDGSKAMPNEDSFYITIDKGQGKGALTVAYNPYTHTSRTVLNDQFSSAFVRPNLVVVEVEVPESELEGLYKAEKAKDSVGEMSWHSGAVSGKLAELGNPRKVILSRYDRPMRILTKKEEAELIAKQLEGTGIAMPYNLVTPQVREELEKLGVKIDEKPSGSVSKNASFGKAEYVTDEQIEAMNGRLQANAVSSPEAMTEAARALSEQLGVPVEIVTDVDSITHPNEAVEVKRRRAKGWYDKRTGKVAIVVPNHLDVEDVAATVFHEVVAHRGLRELVGEQGYDEFLMEVFNHSKADVRERMMALAGKHGWDIPKAVDEYLGGLAERGFGDFSEAERGMWTWLKEKVLEAIDKFIGTLKLPKSVKLGDNELRYLLWRSHENLRAGREGMVKRAMDVAKRYELGLLENEAGERMIDGLETYRSAENRGNTRALPIRERAKAIAHLKPVLVERNEMSKEELRQIYNALPDAVKDGRSISFFHSAFKKNYKEGGLFAQVLPKLNEILKGSVFAYSEKDNRGGEVRPDGTVHKYHPNANAFDNYVGKVEIDGKEYYVRITVQEQQGQVGTHSFFVTSVDVYEKPVNGLSVPNFPSGESDHQRVVDAKLRQFFDEARREDKASEEEDLYRTAYHEAAARDAYERRVKSGLYQSREALQDSMLGLRTAMEEVLKAEGSGYSGRVEDIPGFENAYLGENRLSSVNQAEVDEFGRRLFKPLLEIAASFGSSKEARQALTDYMMAKHGLERNALMRERAKKKAMEELEGDALQKKLDSIEKRDFAGLTALTGKKKVVDAEQAARKMVADFEQASGQNGDPNRIDKLWKAVRGVTGATLKKMKDSGLITKEQFDEISGMYDFYIPLRGFDGQTAEDVYDYLGHGGNGSAFTSPIKKAEGRKSKADDPFAYMAAMAESAIMQGNRNVLVKQKFLNFVLNHPSDLVSVSDLWLRYDAAAGEWRVAQSGDIVGTEKLEEGDSPEEVERKMAVFEERMQAEAEAHPKEYKRQKEHPEIPYRVVEKQDLREHQVIVKRNGRDYVLTINGSPRAAQALNGLTNPNLDVSGVAGTLMNGVRNTTNYLSQVYTTRNPNFVGSNWARDAIYSNIMAGLKEDGEYGLEFSKAWLEANPVSMSILYSLYEHGELDMNNEKQRLFAEFMANGGETGYMSFRQIEERKNEIERQLKLYDGKMPLRKGWRYFWDKVDYANRVVENQSRFAAYMASRRSGRTIDRSIYDAKEITVNFNKKGAGSTFYNAKNQTLAGKVAGGVSGIGRFGFAFWNAAIQGTTNFARFVKRNPKKGVAVSLATMALGYAVPLWASIFHDDDDDKEGSGYFDLPDAVRRDNFVFRFPGMDSWITIPLPVEYRALYGLGELTATAMYRASIGMPMTAGEIAGQAMGQISQLMALDLSEGGGMDFTWGASGNFNALAPSAVKPVAEAWTNKSWTGLPVYKDTPYNKQDPEWTKAFKNTNTFLVKMCKQLNEWTGGDSVKGGAVDLNPAVMEHLLKGYLGGYMQTANQIGKLTGVFGERKNEFRNWPVVSRFLQEGDERTKWRAVTERYFNLKKEAEETDRQLKRYKRLTELGEDHQADIDELIKTDAYKRMEVYDSFENDIQKIQDVLKRNDLSDEERKQVEGELNEIRLELLKAVDELGNLTGLGTGRLGAVTGDLLAE